MDHFLLVASRVLSSSRFAVGASRQGMGEHPSATFAASPAAGCGATADPLSRLNPSPLASPSRAGAGAGAAAAGTSLFFARSAGPLAGPSPECTCRRRRRRRRRHGWWPLNSPCADAGDDPTVGGVAEGAGAFSPHRGRVASPARNGMSDSRMLPCIMILPAAGTLSPWPLLGGHREWVRWLLPLVGAGGGGVPVGVDTFVVLFESGGRESRMLPVGKLGKRGGCRAACCWWG